MNPAVRQELSKVVLAKRWSAEVLHKLEEEHSLNMNILVMCGTSIGVRPYITVFTVNAHLTTYTRILLSF